MEQTMTKAKDGAGSLADLRRDDPATFWRLVAQLVPSDLTINIVKFGDTDDQPTREA